MLFRVSHVTDYHYTAPVAEAYLELRLKPLNRRDQAIKRHTLTLEPTVTPSHYEDYFGNQVSVVSLPFRHSRLVIESEAVVSTTRLPLPEQSLALSVQESRQILSSTLPFSFDYLQPTEMVKIGRDATQWAKRYLRGNAVVREGLEELNRNIYQTFEYEQGSTRFSTDVGFGKPEKESVRILLTSCLACFEPPVSPPVTFVVISRLHHHPRLETACRR
jgi:transglutaminase-like putative cysteine protease